MKKFFGYLLFFCLLTGIASAQGSERILSFHSDIKVETDGSMTVTETIRVVAAGIHIKHGIYRDFPTRYHTPFGNNMNVGFQILSILRDGQPEEYHTQYQTNGIRIYIGRKTTYVPPGEHTYTLTYATNRQLGFFKDHDELYWNVTGNGWVFLIDKASASVELPPSARDRIIEVDALTGLQGAKRKDFQSRRDSASRILFQTTHPLRAREGLTILISWKKGCITEPTESQKFAYFIKDNLGVLIGSVGLVILFLFFIFSWFRVGKDPARGTIIPLFYPPKEFSPASVRYLMKMGFDHKTVACAVINMAVKGTLTISEAKGKETTLTKTGQGEEKLSLEEKALAAAFFKGSTTLQLKNTRHATISRGIVQLQKALLKNIEKIYFVTNQNYFWIGSLLAVGTILATALFGAKNLPIVLFMSLWLSIWTAGVCFLSYQVVQLWRNVLKGAGQLGVALFLTLFALPFAAGEIFGIGIMVTATSLWFVIISLAAILTTILFYHLLKAPTLQGRKVMDQIEGFKMYLSVAEKDELKMLGCPQKTKELFEQYLPYALALDVEQKWAERFSEILARASQGEQSYHPAWYSGSMWSTAGCAGFASSLGSSLSSSISSSSVAPGSSSGGGGGGSSGGGGGGGGGGGW